MSASIEEWAQRMADLMNSTGVHEGHELEQVGRCVYCSCGQRVQGRAPLAGHGSRWQVRLADGFVAYRGTEDACQERAVKHPGATAERSTA